MKHYDEHQIFGLEFSDFEHSSKFLDDQKLDFEPEDDDLNIGDETDQTTLLD